ncbi:MAG: DUF5615 family PIN-like protein [Pseudonocardiaceae bacterium]
MISSPRWSSAPLPPVVAGWSHSAGREIPRRRSLPGRLARFLSSSGHDALHTLELPDGNRTTDARIAEVADGNDRVVVTKDRDFRDSHLLTGSPL